MGIFIPPERRRVSIHLARNSQGRRAINREVTVFIVDDAREIRVGISRLLVSAGYQVRAFESAEGFLAEQDCESPGCLLLDFCMPAVNGLELQRLLVGSPFARPIVFLSGRGDIHTAVQAMKAGAVNFLTKPIDADRLFAAVEQAIRCDAVQRLDRAMCMTIQRRLVRLTPRERQVMDLVVRGRLNKQIAADLGTGEKTIKVHRARVMSKMVVRSVAELVRISARVGNTADPQHSNFQF
jgi:FixJ family two-component response regulator